MAEACLTSWEEFSMMSNMSSPVVWSTGHLVRCHRCRMKSSTLRATKRGPTCLAPADRATPGPRSSGSLVRLSHVKRFSRISFSNSFATYVCCLPMVLTNANLRTVEPEDQSIINLASAHKQIQGIYTKRWEVTRSDLGVS
jgi:hypothetical protein